MTQQAQTYTSKIVLSLLLLFVLAFMFIDRRQMKACSNILFADASIFHVATFSFDLMKIKRHI